MVTVILKAAKGLARDFGELSQLRTSPREVRNFVEKADQRTQSIIHDSLHFFYPDYNFLFNSKHKVVHDKEAPLWIVHTLEGRMNFMYGIPHFGLSLSLYENPFVTANILYDPLRHELFWSYKGRGTFLNQERVRVSSHRPLAQSIVATSTASLHHTLYHPMKVMEAVGLQTSLRITGSSALDLAYVATGRYDGFWQVHGSFFEYGGALLMIKEAGGFSCDLKQTPSRLVAGNEQFYKVFEAMEASS